MDYLNNLAKKKTPESQPRSSFKGPLSLPYSLLKKEDAVGKVQDKVEVALDEKKGKSLYFLLKKVS